jgi:hypothetical protein
MTAFLTKCFSRDNAIRVGELGFGTNPGVKNPLPTNSHVNERRPGVHIGFGQHNQPKEIVDYECDIHIDLISAGGVVRVLDTGRSIDLDNFIPASSVNYLDDEIEDVLSLEEFGRAGVRE